ncbi:non-ribosomal peptide synthetase [Tistrella bauzanensis]|uniref:non-ribosomal peptide synthetase n=1 Tax=Tistrella TaxID=171436 RepID=UPI0031F5F5F9
MTRHPRAADAMRAAIRPDRLERPVFAVFEAAVAIDPQAVAVFGGTTAGEAVTRYGELHLMACSIAAAVDAASPLGVPVAVALPASAGCLAALLAALAAGRPCVPLDPSFPADRNRMIMDHAGVGLLVTDRASSDRSPALAALALAAGAAVILIDDRPRLPPSDWHPTGRADDIAWVIYTSGSTGSPKGVCQTQRGLLHDIFQYLDVTGIGPGDRLTQLYSPSVGGALRDMYGAVLSGAALVPVDLRAEGIAGAARRFQAARPTVFHAMPTVLRALTDSGAGPAALGGARLAYLAGERIFADDLARVFASAPDDLLIYVGIGSTENATIYRHWLIDRTTAAGLDGGLVPVGWPVADRRMRLIDAAGQPVADGEVGEIEVESAFMAAGYWRDPALTTATFQTGGDVAPGARRLRTGDLGRLRPDGLLDFIGRADRQVKIRGYRVEPAEVEAVLRALPGVGDAAVLPDQAAGPASGAVAGLAAVLVPARGTVLDLMALRRRLAATQPPHLLPRRLLVAADLPRLANFKLDGAALSAWIAALPEVAPEPDTAAVEPPARAVPDDLDAAIDAAWAEILGSDAPLSGVSLRDLGGDSLDLLRLAARIESLTGLAPPLDLLGGDVTPQRLRVGMRSGAVRKVPDGDDGGRTRLLFMLSGAPGASEGLFALAGHLQAGYRVQIVPLPDLDHELRSRREIGDLAREATELIMTRLADAAADAGETPDGRPPGLALFGLSFGGRIAATVAAELAARGRPAELVVIGDIPARYRDAAAIMAAGGTGRRPGGAGAWLRRGLGDGFGRAVFHLAHRKDRRLLRCLVGAARMVAPGRAMRGLVERRAASSLRRSMVPGWQPPTLSCPVLLIVTDGTRHNLAALGEDLGWRRSMSRLSVVRVPGDHVTIAADIAGLSRIAEAMDTAWPQG